jgi:hypothetical protein
MAKFNPIPVIGRQYRMLSNLPDRGSPEEFEVATVSKVTETEVAVTFADGGVGYFNKREWNYHAREAK